MKHMLHGIDTSSGELPTQDHYTDLDVSTGTIHTSNPGLLRAQEVVLKTI